jgi:hypothetical protein
MSSAPRPRPANRLAADASFQRKAGVGVDRAFMPGANGQGQLYHLASFVV